MQIVQRHGDGEQLSYAVHVKPVRKHQLHHMVGVDDEGHGHSLARVHIQNSHTHKTQSHTVRTVPWWFSNCTILKRGIHTSHHNPIPHNPSYVTVHVPGWLPPSLDMRNHLSISPFRYLSFGVSSPMRLFQCSRSLVYRKLLTLNLIYRMLLSITQQNSKL